MKFVEIYLLVEKAKIYIKLLPALFSCNTEFVCMCEFGMFYNKMILDLFVEQEWK